MQRKKLVANINFDDNYETEEYENLDKTLLDIIDVYIYIYIYIYIYTGVLISP